MTTFKKIVITLCSAVGAVGTVYASTWYVAPGASGSGSAWEAPASLAEAFSKSSDGDTILIMSGDYEVASQMEVSGKALTIKGGMAGTDDVAKDGGKSVVKRTTAGITTRLFKFAASTVSFEDVVFTGGNSGSGNAVYASGSDLTFTDCVMSNNYYDAAATSGGALFVEGGTLVLNDSLFANNGLAHNGSPPAISHRNTRCVDRAGKYFLEYAA